MCIMCMMILSLKNSASKFPVVLEMMTKHYWGQFIGPPYMLGSSIAKLLRLVTAILMPVAVVFHITSQ